MSDSPTGEGKLYKQPPEVHVKTMHINSLTVSKTTVKLAYKQVFWLQCSGSNSQIFFIPMKEEYEGVGERKTHAVITFSEPKFPYIQFLYKQVLLYVAKQTY